MSQNQEANKEQMKSLDNFVKDMKDDQKLPYYQAHAEVTAAISNMNNPPNYTQQQIDKVLGKHGMGPNAFEDQES